MTEEQVEALAAHLAAELQEGLIELGVSEDDADHAVENLYASIRQIVWSAVETD